MKRQHAIRNSVEQSRTADMVIIAVFTILAGLAEVVTGFTHNFFGIITASAIAFTYSSVVIGIFYVVAGFLILTMNKWASLLAIALLCADIIGRIALVLAGLYPIDSLKNTFSIIAGTLIVAIIAFYIAWKRKFFR